MRSALSGNCHRILDHVARANQVALQFLEYVGLQDERHTVGKTDGE